ncbi:hypothetical protein DL98DRAFT_597226 [Cadophora sp. DSE1049]|nr:hypothetical protein DL98DRAFT_597226 [Cadophora sp. DSE1049]
MTWKIFLRDCSWPVKPRAAVQDPLTTATGVSTAVADGGQVMRIATAEEFAADKLCDRRPAPSYYDEYRLKKEVKGRTFIILRQDRFAFAACADKAELDIAAARIEEVLSGIDVD